MKRASALLLCFVVSNPTLVNAKPESLIEKIEAYLQQDEAYSDKEREAYLAEFRQQLGAYAFDVLKPNTRPGAEVVMSIVTEGSFGKIPLERTVGIAVGAWVAISRGAPAQAVEGIAKYGFQRNLSTDKISTFAKGFQELVQFGVPTKIAQELVYQAASRNWDTQIFNTLKWALVQAKKKGYDITRFRTYLLGHYLKGNLGPGAVMNQALRAFARDGKPALPAYKSPFIDRSSKPQQTGKTKPTSGQKELPKAPVGKDAHQGQSSSNVWAKLWNVLKKAIDSFIGTPYVWGGTTRRGTDCSGFTQSVFAQIGISLPRNSRQQWRQGTPVTRNQLKRGDLVFFITIGKRISHVGIVTSAVAGEFTHASSSRGVVRSKLDSRYYSKRYAGARRMINQ